MDTEQMMAMLLPKAVNWVEAQEGLILREGARLSESERADAVGVGVKFPDSVRILRVDELPKPNDPILLAAASAAGLFFSHSIGMALRYGIYLRRDLRDERPTLVHELTHTAQYERLGGVHAFLTQYVRECLSVGYSDCSLEVEAVETTDRIIANGSDMRQMPKG